MITSTYSDRNSIAGSGDLSVFIKYFLTYGCSKLSVGMFHLCSYSLINLNPILNAMFFFLIGNILEL